MATVTQNRLESRVASITIDGHPHELTAWFVVALRFVMGGMLLFAGLGKFSSGDGFNAAGFLANVHPASPVSGLYGAMAANPLLIDLINVIVPITQVLIGIALIVGAFVRLAAFGGAIQMFAFYLGGWEGQWLAIFDSTLIFAVVFLTLGALAAGRILGLDRVIERISIRGEPLIDRYPVANYLLG